MNLLSKIFLIALIISTYGCNQSNKKHSSHNQQNYEHKEQINSTKDSHLKKEETLDDFLDRAIKAAKSNSDVGLKEIIEFPLYGYAETYKSKYKSYENLKSDGRIYSFFKEYIALSEEIEADEAIPAEVGDSKEQNKWYSFRYLGDSYVYFKLDRINGKYIIIGVYIPKY